MRFGPEGGVEWERRPGGDGVQWLDSAMRTEAGYLFTGGSESGPNGGIDGYALATDDAGDPRWQSHHGTDGWDKPWPAIRAHGGGYLLAGMTSGAGSGGMDGWLVRIGPASTSDGATDEGSADETTTDDAGDATEAGMQGDAPTDTGTADGPIPGFGVGAALVALVVLVAVLLAGRE